MQLQMEHVPAGSWEFMIVIVWLGKGFEILTFGDCNTHIFD